MGKIETHSTPEKANEAGELLYTKLKRPFLVQNGFNVGLNGGQYFYPLFFCKTEWDTERAEKLNVCYVTIKR